MALIISIFTKNYKMICADWFEKWFDSPYYHLLYQHRNFNEANFFIDNLLHYLQPQKNSHFLDLGCGKGRHSFYLNQKGYDVTGIDLSKESISEAKKIQNESLKFFVRDMRNFSFEKKFDFIFNMFTSFGYFENEKDNYAVIDAVAKVLAPNGIFVLDFMNAKKVMNCLVENEKKIVNGIEFFIKKKIKNNFIIKDISFSDKGKEYHFQECVKMLSHDDFEKYFSANNLKIFDLKGNFKLENFNSDTSERLILFAKRYN